MKEKRKAKRRPILDTFSLFAVVPEKGVHRLRVHDISDLGIGFDIDIEGDATSDFSIKQGQSAQIHLYLNQTLYIPLSIKIARIETKDTVRYVGAEFSDRDSKSYKALVGFLAVIDQLAEAGQVAR